MGKSNKEEKLTRIKTEEKRLTGIYTKIGRKSKKLIDGLIKRAAYMRVTLEDYEVDLDEGGYTEMFTQSISTPPFERERPVARLYNAMNKNYQSIMKQLADMLPDEEPKGKKGDGFDDFVNGRDEV